MSSALTDEQRERIARSKAAALERRRQSAASASAPAAAAAAAPGASPSRKRARTDAGAGAGPCEACGGSSGAVLDERLLAGLAERVCGTCRDADEAYELLTKADAKTAYLLTESQLNLMAHLEKPNPRNAKWTAMKMYLRKHCSEAALKRWKTEDGLHAERQKRRGAQYAKQAKAAEGMLRHLAGGGGAGGGGEDGDV